MNVQLLRTRLILPVLLLSLFALGGCGGSDPVPNPPTGLTMSSTVSQNVLTWDAVSGYVYNVYRGTAPGAEAPIGSTEGVGTYTDTPPVSSRTPLYYYVTAVDVNGLESNPSVVVSVVPPVLSLTGVSSTSVFLSWAMPASASGVTGYNVYRSTASGAEAPPFLASAMSSPYADNTVVHGTTYYYRVTAVGQNGETLGSNEVTASP